VSEKNAFGGGNANSLYVPMSETEQEALSRLVAAGDLRVVIVGWGHVERPRISFGDARIGIRFGLDFNRPEVPMAVSYFDLELRTGSGLLLFRERQKTLYNDQPILVAAGVHLELAWDIAIQMMDPRLVKALVPGAIGLTSRLLDKDTGQATLDGNMRLDSDKKRLLRQIREGEARVRRK